jgi:hypothetical protein
VPFSKPALTLAFWAINLDHNEVFVQYERIRICVTKVMKRPALAAKFDLLINWRDAYASLQAQGGGVM